MRLSSLSIASPRSTFALCATACWSAAAESAENAYQGLQAQLFSAAGNGTDASEDSGGHGGSSPLETPHIVTIALAGAVVVVMAGAAVRHRHQIRDVGGDAAHRALNSFKERARKAVEPVRGRVDPAPAVHVGTAAPFMRDPFLPQMHRGTNAGRQGSPL